MNCPSCDAKMYTTPTGWVCSECFYKIWRKGNVLVSVTSFVAVVVAVLIYFL